MRTSRGLDGSHSVTLDRGLPPMEELALVSESEIPSVIGDINAVTECVTVAVPRDPSLIRDEFVSAVRRLGELHSQDLKIDQEMRELIAQLELLSPTPPAGPKNRPFWGPCTRCAHHWRGHDPNHPPRGCPRCGSTGWRIPPTTGNARRPTDPPNPRWGKNRITGEPTRPHGQGKHRRDRKQQAPVIETEAPATGIINPSARGVTTRRERARSLTPPPRPEEVSSALASPPASTPAPRISLVPPPNVRFAEPSPELAPDVGVPTAEEEINRISNAEVAKMFNELREPLTELQEAVESDGGILPEEEDSEDGL
jgi:hypothetical protein